LLQQITPLILTYNEAPNIRRTLEQLRWAADIVVVDSFSNDETVQIASEFPQLRVVQRKFDSHENQWNFGLKETDIETDWVLAMDADYFLTPAGTAELERLSPGLDICGYRAPFIYCINGQALSGGIYPPVIVLYRRDRARYCQDGHTQKLIVEGRVETLASPILHDDRKPLKRWFQSQTLYTKLEAEKLLRSDWATLSWTDRMRRWRLLAPLAICFYCLILKGGILDGRAGFYYAFQRTLAELMLSLYLIDQDIRHVTASPRKEKKQQLASTSEHVLKD
jgi:glycosyltransferase involved in cell wall biosynthesis